LAFIHPLLERRPMRNNFFDARLESGSTFFQQAQSSVWT